MGTMTITIPDAAEKCLRQQAAAAGKPLEQLVSDVLVAQARPTLDDISGTVHQRFQATGMREDELANILEREDHESREVPYNE